MKKTKKIIVVAYIFFSAFSVMHGQNNFNKVAQSGMQYLKIGVDAAMVGRGEAGISAVRGVSSMFWNPAGLSQMDGHELLFSHNAWIADISMNAAAIGLNFDNIGTFGLSVLWMDYGDLHKTSVATSTEEAAAYGYVDEGLYSPSDIAIGLAYSRKISDQFSFGGQVRYLYENYGSNKTISFSGEEEITDNILSAFCFDFGTLYYPGFKSLAISMSIQNFSSDLKYQQESFSTPLIFKIGTSFNVLDLFDNKSKSNLLLAIDAIHPRDFSERLNLGIEYDYLGLFQVRGGYRLNYDEVNFTTGAGVKYSISNTMGIKVDISYIIFSSGRFSWPLQLTARLIML